MRCILVESFGGPEALKLVDRPTPAVGVGQALVAVDVAGIGLVDVLRRRGQLPGTGPGFVPGGEVAGTVVAVGAGVGEAWLGSRVLAAFEGGGGYAEHVATGVDELTPLPPTVSAAHAVALGTNALVAMFALQHARLRAGERVLVRGASGGIGVLATQLGAYRGATVAVATSSPDRGRRLQQLGASEILDRSGRVRGSGETPDEGFDVVIDPVAGPDIGIFLDQLNANGRLVIIGAAGGFPNSDFGMGLLGANRAKSLSLSVMSMSSVSPMNQRVALQEIFAMAGNGSLQPVIDEIVPLEDASVAHEKLESGDVFGKIMLGVSR